MIDERDTLAIRGLSIARWEAGVIRTETLADLAGAVEVEPGPESVAIRNETARTLSRVFVRTPSGFFLGGPIPSGGRATLGLLGPGEIAASEPPLGRSSLARRVHQDAIEWVQRRPGPWSLAAIVEPDPAPHGGRLQADERAALLLVEP